LTKTQLIYSVSCFNLGGLGALFRGKNPPEAPRGDGTGLVSSDFYYCCTRNSMAVCTACQAPYSIR